MARGEPVQDGVGALLTCEQALAPMYGGLVRRALFAGWTPEEIGAAIASLAARAITEDGAGLLQGTSSAGCIPGCGHRPGRDEPADLSRWSKEDQEFARLFEDVFPPEAIRRIIAAERQTEAVTLRLDRAVIDAFKAEGADWHARINEALRAAKAMAERP